MPSAVILIVVLLNVMAPKIEKIAENNPSEDNSLKHSFFVTDAPANKLERLSLSSILIRV